jgi:undecaprenyl-phosphate galactose phosphotransferase/putative colanic acid biosynthesis UDP-glucose lipid carrier transferase
MLNDTGALAHSSIRRKAALRIHDRLALPFEFIEPAAIAVDFALLVGTSLLAGVSYHWIVFNGVPDVPPYLAIGALAGLNVTTILAALGQYKFQALLNPKRQARDVAVVWIGVFLTLLGMAFSLKLGEALSRGATLGFFIAGLTALLSWRACLSHLLAKAIATGTFAKQKTLLIGDDSLLATSPVVNELRHYGYSPTAIYGVNLEGDLTSNLVQTLGPAIRAAREDSVKSILLLFRWDQSRYIEAVLGSLSVLPIPIYLVPDPSVVRYMVRTHNIGPIWTAELKRAPLSKIEQLLKRSVDLIGASLALLLLSPLMLGAAVLIKLDSNGPILFTQRRSGFNGHQFRIFKFRTMNVLEDGPVIQQAVRSDPRVTRVGRWLRRSNIDELPQLFNVLRGDMSLVGPRPHAAAHDSEYERKIADYAFRFQLKPGITGWAQSNGYRGETQTLDSMMKRIEHDLWYINNWSIWLDLRIIIRTLSVGIADSRAY